MSLSVNARAVSADRLFFGGMGLAMCVTVFYGFAPSYYLARPDAPPLSPIVHAHGFAATAWMLLFLAQVALVGAHRVDLHRRLGAFGAALAVGLIVATLAASIEVRGFTPRVTFSAGAVVMFVIYVAAGFLQRRRPDAHKRLMLLATIPLLPPAIARMPFIPDGGASQPPGVALSFAGVRLRLGRTRANTPEHGRLRS
jgi:hypothetical protein